MDVELRDIHKSFGKLQANNGINLKVPAGTIQGILGENGAGKSTLMKVLSGFIRADGGEILLDKHPVNINSPADAIRKGVGMLHQDPLDFPPMRVIDNFILGRKGSLFPNRSRAIHDFTYLASQFGFNLSPETYVDSLTVGERQQLEILRLLWLGAGVLIFDEPTTGISASQKTKLFDALRLLAKKGKTILFVSHKLEDVEGLCDKVAILRQGSLVGEAVPPYSTENLVEMMFGKNVIINEKIPCKSNDIVLSLHNISAEDYRLKVKNVSLDLRCGEVLGLAGMEGSGQTIFMRSIVGLERTVGGRIIFKDHDMTGRSYHAFKRQAAAFLPAARLEEGLVPGLNLMEHFVLAEEMQGFFVRWEKGKKITEERIADYKVRGEPASTVESLSGGNQQRALLALLRNPLSLLLLEHPTRGLDVESTIYIWTRLKERCSQGTAIIFTSSDLEELLQYSDRVLVFFSGRVTPPIEATALTTDILGQLIGGKRWDEFLVGVNHEE